MTTDLAPLAADAGPVLQLEAPPTLEEPPAGGGSLAAALPVVGSVGSVLVLATSGGEARTRALVAAALFLLATVGVLVLQADRQRQRRLQQVGERRSDYLARLDRSRRSLVHAAVQQRAHLERALPAPATLPLLLATRPRGGRAAPDGLAGVPPGSAGTLLVRWGLVRQAPAVTVVPPEQQPPRPDPVGAHALDRLLAHPACRPLLPAALDLAAQRQVVLTGPPAARRALARALVVSAAAAHPPESLRVACLHDDETAPTWGWCAWLPHAGSAAETDLLGPARLVVDDLDRLARLAPGASASPGACPEPHLLVVVDTTTAPSDVRGLLPRPDRTTVLRLDDAPDAADLVLDLSGAGGPERPSSPPDPAELTGHPGLPSPTDPGCPARAHRPGRPPVVATADQCDLVTATAVARALAGREHRVASALPSSAGRPPGPGPLAGLAPADPARSWRPRGRREPLRVALGEGPHGPVQLDLEEAAVGGQGPHGLVVGATGSGKSELLRTIVLALAVGHPPDDLNLALVDFKGGATFAGLGRLPQVSALITNLTEEAPLVDRMRDALEGELLRRQEVLRAAGDLGSVREHEARRAAGAPLAPLPRLLLVVDEFTEMLAARPDLLDLVVTIGRLGRSLGVHLLLATQRLEEGRLRGLESHLSVRIALRTASATESRAVLGVPDAATLPASPGLGLLRTGPEAPVAFRAPLVSAPLVAAPRNPVPSVEGDLPAPVLVLPFTAAPAGPAPQPPPAGPPDPAAPGHPPATGPTLLSAAVDALAAHAQAVGHAAPHRVWLPPLDASPTLADLVPLAAQATPAEPGPTTGMRVPVGTVDLPREQRREPLVLDLAGAGGHVAVVGGPRSGRSSTVRTLVAAVALTASPRAATALLLDLGGGGLAALADLPHVGARVERDDPDGVRRVVAHVRALVDRREARPAADGSRDGWPDGRGEVLLVVDDWSTLRREHPDLEDELTALAARGLGAGLHLVVTAHRWSDLRPALRDLLGSRIELRLGDPFDSVVDRRAAAAVPADRPGRGLRGDGAHLLVARPRLEGSEADLVRLLTDRWRGCAAPRLTTLPGRVALGALPDRRDPRPAHDLVLGLAEDGETAAVDLAADRHLLVLGGAGSGRTSVLRTALRGLLARGPDRVQVLLLDPRRSLVGEVPTPHLLDDVSETERATAACHALADRLRRRLPTPATTPAQLRERSWWDGPDVAVVVDDHDLLLAAAVRGGSPLAPLLPLVPRSADVGLHLLVARRAAGAARGTDPVAALLRDLGAPGLLLSARADDGPLLGLRPHPAPPGRGRLVGRDGRVRTVQVAWTGTAT